MSSLLALCLSFAVALMPAPGPRVVNTGFPGNNSAELDGKFDAAVQEAHPGFVVLFAGGNDALNDAKLLTTAETAAHLRGMVRRAEAAGAVVVLVTVHDADMERLMKRHRPEAYGAMPPLQRLAAVNAAIARIAAEEHTGLVDFHETLRRAGGANAALSTDGVHLTAAGYRMLAEDVRSALPAHLTATDTVLCFGDSLTYGQGVRAANSADTPQTYPSQLRELLQQ